MAFNLQTWRDQCKTHLKDLKQRIADLKVDSIYGTIAAAAFWPVVAAFQQGEFSALLELGKVLAGVGTNLLAGSLQSWRDQAEAARELKMRSEREPALREELDTIIEKLDAIALARAELPEKDRQWFVNTLQQELQKLGNLPRFEATLRGVVVGKDVRKSVIVTGDNNCVNYIINYYNTNNPHPADPKALRRHIADYLTWMRERCGTIELRGIKREGQQVVQLDLETVYVPLQAQAYIKVEKKKRGRNLDEPPVARTIKMQQVLEQGQRLVITGGPGCGKTTVLMHIAWTLVAAMAVDDPAYAHKKLGITGDLPLPIFVPLSAYATHLRQLPANTDPRQRTLAAFISDYLIERQSSFDLPREFFQQLLRQGQAVILLLDGLDEVPDEDDRARVRQAIEELVTGRDHMRVVVTCRSAAYKDRSALGKNFHEVRVLPLDDQHVESLVVQAYKHLYRHDPKLCQNKTKELLDGIRRLEEQRRQRFGKDTEPLVTSPLLVRMLIVVHFSERQLPEQRAELYMKATDAMMKPEYAPDEEITNRIGRQVGGSLEKHRDLVQHLAFTMHRRGEKLGREISEDDLRAVLRQNPAYATAINDFIALTRLRGTLLEERLGVYRFIHLAFQEYLAARYLAEITRGESGVEGIATFLESGPILESWWREPALLVAGYLNVTSPQTAQLYLQRLAGTDEPTEKRQLTPEVQMAAAEVAATACLEVPASPESLRKQLADRLAGLFEQTDLMAHVRPVLRAAAGEAMARLGDPREKVMSVDKMQFCLIPAGPFWMGSDKNDKDADDDEKPMHCNENLNYDYWIAQYPVTVAQFRAFVEATKHKPENEDSLRDLLNRPVCYVTWYEAIKFCEWLTKKWQRENKLPKDWAVRLPSEAEWEKAARGGLKIPAQPIIKSIDTLPLRITASLRDNPEPKRRFPWGNEPDPNCANYDDTGIGTTSAVGCFPNGKSPYGVQELSGNVWEWTRSLWGTDWGQPKFKYPYNPTDGRENLNAPDNVLRVLRGGAFGDNVRNVRCAVRSWYDPGDRDWFDGFRLAAAPVGCSH